MILSNARLRKTITLIIIPIFFLGILTSLFLYRIKTIDRNINTLINKLIEEESQNNNIHKSKINEIFSKLNNEIKHAHILAWISFTILSIASILLVLLFYPIGHSLPQSALAKIHEKVKRLVKTRGDSVKNIKYPIEHLENDVDTLISGFQQERLHATELDDKFQRTKGELEQVFSISGEGIRIIDIDFNVLRVNKAFSEFVGTTIDKCLNKKCYEIFGGTYCNSSNCSLKRILSGEEEQIDMEVQRKRINGNKVDCILHASAIYNQDHKAIGIAESFKDISQIKHSQRILKKLNQEIRTKNRQLEDFVYITTHDLRSPLINLEGFSDELERNIKELGQLLQKLKIPKYVRKKLEAVYREEIPECMHFIKSSTTKMTNLVDALQQLSRLKRYRLNIKELNMNNILKEVQSNFQTEAKQYGAKIVVEDLPAALGDENQINQVVSNLLSNAIHYLGPKSSQGRIHISGKRNGSESIFCVEDNGIGINPKYQSKIFQVFQRLEPAMSKGEGIGLSIVSKILENHGGRIWVESGEGVGSKFFFVLPA